MEQIMGYERPNVLWLILDSGRFDHISAHGYERPTTPNIDNLISTGLDYQRAYSACIWSLPSYTSLLTGRYPRQHGVNIAGQMLRKEIPTLPAAFRLSGYSTGCFSNNAWLEPTFGLDSGFQHFERLWYAAQEEISGKALFWADRAWGKFRGEEDKGARRTNRQVVKWLKEQRDEPTFTFVAYVEPHTPYTEHRNVQKKILNLPVRTNAWRSFEPYKWVTTFPEPFDYAPELLNELHDRYDIEMRYIDTLVGTLLDDLKNNGLLDNTIVIITADHGEMLGEQNIFGHQFSVAEPLRHVPLVIWAPSFWSESEKINDLVQTLDLAATLAKWCDVDWESTQDTHVLPEKNCAGTREYAITDYPEPYLDAVKRKYKNVDLSHLNVGLTCISDCKHKLIYRDDVEWKRYDLDVDPLEQGIYSVENSSDFAKLTAHLEDYIAHNVEVKHEVQEIPPEVMLHLRALGYVE